MADQELDSMERDLELIANLTLDTEEKVVYMKDSTVVAQKSSQSGNGFILNISHSFQRQWMLIFCLFYLFIYFLDSYVKKSANMLDDVLRFEKTIYAQEQQIL